ncbi:hypothetical protein UFOVP978_19 [uncultured Caudovirales phage]|uniref:Uncharacterized protein n=1 Tax=uncultured Caudovirales phage TaxID=2100421 RepID=A0A6J5PWL3_9CAUD|nr:hypothetical protein UFOVP978_19 [uncultured Caudovirales phage]
MNPEDFESALEAISKGESQGHPFRGNQWTKGRPGGGSRGIVGRANGYPSGRTEPAPWVKTGVKRIKGATDQHLLARQIKAKLATGGGSVYGETLTPHDVGTSKPKRLSDGSTQETVLVNNKPAGTVTQRMTDIGNSHFHARTAAGNPLQSHATRAEAIMEVANYHINGRKPTLLDFQTMTGAESRGETKGGSGVVGQALIDHIGDLGDEARSVNHYSDNKPAPTMREVWNILAHGDANWSKPVISDWNELDPPSGDGPFKNFGLVGAMNPMPQATNASQQPDPPAWLDNYPPKWKYGQKDPTGEPLDGFADSRLEPLESYKATSIRYRDTEILGADPFPEPVSLNIQSTPLTRDRSRGGMSSTVFSEAEGPIGKVMTFSGTKGFMAVVQNPKTGMMESLRTAFPTESTAMQAVAAASRLYASGYSTQVLVEAAEHPVRESNVRSIGDFYPMPNILRSPTQGILLFHQGMTPEKMFATLAAVEHIKEMDSKRFLDFDPATDYKQNQTMEGLKSFRASPAGKFVQQAHQRRVKLQATPEWQEKYERILRPELSDNLRDPGAERRHAMMAGLR